ncbi:hypothetical protein ILUMI_25028 [Ignelater luminosus]|uniref:Uncharacterized protein n=1 Tax=Ignelater luminosus TaxID=2038154 RepID=A0A8K0C651_IGNLU|nr:hypothetical protein ILUMI_25028 [Ignelater luminosus]
MKGIIALVVVTFFAATQALSDEAKAKLREHYEHCTGETKVDKELINKARKGEFSNDDKLQQYYFCMFNRIGILDADGKPQPDVLKDKIAAAGDIKTEDAEKVIAACKDKKGADKYETARLIYECYYTVSPQHISFA